MALQPHATTVERVAYYGLRVFCIFAFIFLIAPNLVIIPLSFNEAPYFVYPLSGFSFRWYEDLFLSERWAAALKNSLIIGTCATVLSISLGTLAALGLARREFPFKPIVMGVLLFPMIVPTIITAVGLYFFFARIGLIETYLGVILAHTLLATPFVVITVTATLTNFDYNVVRAAASLGASPARVFFQITLPIILPGVVSGGLFAFATSFDELVVMLFISGAEQRTLPRQMWSGIREMISPTILAAATLLVIFAILMMVLIEYLNKRNEKLRASGSNTDALSKS